MTLNIICVIVSAIFVKSKTDWSFIKLQLTSLNTPALSVVTFFLLPLLDHRHAPNILQC